MIYNNYLSKYFNIGWDVLTNQSSLSKKQILCNGLQFNFAGNKFFVSQSYTYNIKIVSSYTASGLITVKLPLNSS